MGLGEQLTHAEIGQPEIGNDYRMTLNIEDMINLKGPKILEKIDSKDGKLLFAKLKIFINEYALLSIPFLNSDKPDEDVYAFALRNKLNYIVPKLGLDNSEMLIVHDAANTIYRFRQEQFIADNSLE